MANVRDRLSLPVGRRAYGRDDDKRTESAAEEGKDEGSFPSCTRVTRRPPAARGRKIDHCHGNYCAVPLNLEDPAATCGFGAIRFVFLRFVIPVY